MFHLDDVVILGLAVPEQHRDGRKTICVAAYHQDLGMIRIFPCSAEMGLSRWQKVSVSLEKNPKDTRYESYRLYGSDSGFAGCSIASSKSKVAREKRIDILEKLKCKCVSEINTARFSLGVVKPIIEDVWIDNNPTFDKQRQSHLSIVDDKWLKTKGDYPYQPRIRYRCSDSCNGHSQTILEWGAFEWMRKNPKVEDIVRLRNNWMLGDSEYEHYLIVGNQLQHRTSFIVINLIHIKTGVVQTPSIKQSDFLLDPSCDLYGLKSA